jgi:eukaryotic-like serine/threonine-protein kinase
MALTPGTKLGPYDIVALLGAGGMGEVYRARDTRLQRAVAIKILSPQFSSDPVRKQRFEREARTISNLNHPHICVLHDIGHQDGIDYLVMECVEGETLAKRLEKGPLPLQQVMRLGAQIADALDKAHRSGVVHRDLKPGNIMLTPTGAKLLDFGLAKPAALASGATLTAAATQTTPVTQEGTVVGTFQYMSPEQIEGKELDGRSDIFSLGAVLYETLTGQRAFQGKNQLSVASAILEKEPTPICSIKPTTPPALDHAIRRCLAKEPERRWQSAADLAGELQWIAESGSQAGVAAPSVPLRKLRERMGWALALPLAIIAMIAAVGWWRATRPVLYPLIRVGTELTPAPGVFTFRIGETLIAKSQPGTSLALSPDGSRLAVPIRDADGNLRLAIRRLDENQFKPLPGTENPTSPFFSQDGQWVAFFGDGKLRKIPVQGGAPALLCDADNFPSGSWGDDDNIIAALSSQGGLSRIPSTGGAPTPVTELRKGEIMHRWPQVLPGSQAVLFTAYRGGGTEESSIDILSFKNHERKTVVRGGVMGRYLSASNGAGYLVYLHQNTLLAVPFDISNLAVTSAAQPILDDVTAITATSPGDFDFSRNGTFVYISGKGEPERSIFWLDHTGKTEPLHPTPGFYNGMRFSPDGKRLVFATGYDALGRGDLWVQDLERNTITRLTSLPGASQSPVWSADGKYILFSVRHQPDAGLYWIRSDGAGEPQQTAEEIGSPTSFSPDGKRVTLQRGNPFTAEEVWIAPVEETPDHLLLGKSELFLHARGFPMPAFSPDGRWLAYASSETGTSQIYVRPFPGPGGKVAVSTGGGFFPIWSPNGRELYFNSLDQHIMAVDYTARADSFSPGKPRVWSPQRILLNVGGGPFQPYALAPDGKRFVVTLYPDGTTERHNTLQLTFLLNFPDQLRRRVTGE